MSGDSYFVFIIGMGSAGLRHATILQSMGHQVIFITSRVHSDFKCYSSLSEALKYYKPYYVVIANETHGHYSALQEILQLNAVTKVLIEKPLFHEPHPIEDSGKQIYIAYQLRFHPLLLWLKENLQGKKILQAQIYVGQHLAQWRPKRHYSQSYSASKVKGGGVLRDLSHELDYALWLLGSCKRLTAMGGRYSDLEIDSDDIYAIMMETEHCPIVTIQMNYLDKISRREITVITSDETYSIDLKNLLVRTNITEYNLPYVQGNENLDLHQAILSDEKNHACTLAEGQNILSLIQAIETASLNKSWMCI